MAEKANVVGDIMHKGVIACLADTPLQEVVRIMSDTDVSAVVVVGEQEEALGVISNIDVLKHFGKELENYEAKDVMTHPVVSICPTDTIDEAVKVMVDKDIHRLVVTEDGPGGKRPVGILSTTDVVKEMRGARWVWYMG